MRNLLNLVKQDIVKCKRSDRCTLFGIIVIFLSLVINSWVDNLIVLFLFCIGYFLILFGLFQEPLKCRIGNVKEHKLFNSTTNMYDINTYINSGASFGDKVMYINHFYREHYYENNNHKELEKKVIDELAQRKLYLIEQIRDKEYMDSLLEKLIFVFFLSCIDNGQYKDVMKIITLIVIVVYYFVVKILAPTDEDKELCLHEITKINALLDVADTPRTDVNWREKKKVDMCKATD